MHVAFPLHFDGRGRTAAAGEDAHVRGLVEQVLFTAPGERVNRPEFGSGLLQLVFAPGGEAIASATQMSVQGSLQRWLAEIIQVETVSVSHRDSTLTVTVEYLVRRTGERRRDDFTREIGT